MASTTKFTFTTVTSSGWNTQNTSNLSVLETALSSCRTGVLGETVERFDSASMHMSDGLWYKAYSFSNCHNVAPCFGVFLSGGDAGDTVRIQTEGAITNPDWALKPGWPVLMGNLPGSVRCAVLTRGNQIIGFADDDHTIYLENNLEFQNTWTSTTTTTSSTTTSSSTVTSTSSTISTTSSTISTTSTTVTGTQTSTSTTSSSTTTTAIPITPLWLSGWLYRKEITISRASGAVTNYQMKVLVGETSGASGADVDCAGHVMTSFADLRFTNSENEPLDYWIESITGTTPNQLATVWVECDYIGTAATVFYMYYGNSTASSESSGTNTFIVFDDFERGSNGDALGGIWSATVDSAVISTEQTYGTGSRSAKLLGGATDWTRSMSCNLAASNEIAIRFRFFKEANAKFDVWHGNGTKCVVVRYEADEDILYYDTDTTVNCQAEAWDFFEITNINFTAGTFDLYYTNGAVAKSGAVMGTDASANGKFRIYDRASGSGVDTYIDNFIVRNWRTTGPVLGAWGSEEVQ